MAGRIEATLAELGITLPTPMAPIANYVPYVVTGNLVVVSGQVPAIDGKIAITGKVSWGVSLDQAKEAARLCFINVLVHLKAACGGDLDRVKRVVRLGGFVAAPSEFTQHALVMNGASDLAVAVFGEAGRHARSTIGVPSLPADAAVEVEGCLKSNKLPNMPDGSATLTLTLHARIAEIDAADWDACAGEGNPFVTHEFLSAMEDSGSANSHTGWLPQHAVLRRDGGEIVGVVPMYAKSHSYGEYVFDHGWANALERVGENYYPKLQAAVPFSPVPGPRLLRRPGAGVPISAMASALEQACQSHGLSSVHVTFCTETEWDGLGQAGWLRRIGMQFHWENAGYTSFEDFLGALSSRKRKVLRRERRDANAAGLTFHALSGAEITERHWDAFYGFYQSTVDRKWGSAYLTRSFFSKLGERLGDKVVLMYAEAGGKPVAGALNLMGDEALYGRNWGCRGDWPFLHFELCYYRAIDWAIDHGLKRVEAGAQGRHKIQRGYMPKPTYSAHWITHSGLRRAVGNFLVEERAGIEAEMAALAEESPFRKGED